MKKYLAASAEFCDQIQTRKYSTTRIRPDEGTVGTVTPVPITDQIASFGRALTAEELAKLLAVSPITIFKQAKQGRIPCSGLVRG
jgi:hypothetical protein